MRMPWKKKRMRKMSGVMKKMMMKKRFKLLIIHKKTRITS